MWILSAVLPTLRSIEGLSSPKGSDDENGSERQCPRRQCDGAGLDLPKGAPRLMAPAEAAGALLLVLAEVSLVAVRRDVIVCKE